MNIFLLFSVSVGIELWKNRDTFEEIFSARFFLIQISLYTTQNAGILQNLAADDKA